MECQPKVFAHLRLFDQRLGVGVNGIRQDHQRHKGGHVLLAGLDVAHARVFGQLDLLFQVPGGEMLRQIEVDVLVVLHGAEHVLLADEVVLIPEEEERRRRETATVHRHIPGNVIVMGIGVEQLFQSFLQGHFHESISLSLKKRISSLIDCYYTLSLKFC